MSSARTEEIAEDSIRADYLRNNDAYITNSLRRLAAIPGLVGSGFCCGSVVEYVKHRAAFKKCGAKIKTWMAVNTDWRNRCEKNGASENIVGYWRGPSTFDIETQGVNAVFNNPAVAVELGLLDVLKVHIEEFGTNISSQTWTGLLTNGHGSAFGFSLMHLALAADDQDLLKYVLDAPTFTFSDEMERIEWFHDLFTNPNEIPLKSVETLFSHEKVVVNFLFYPDRETPLLEILGMLRNKRGDDHVDWHVRLCERALDVLRILLRCGADPEYDISKSPSSAYDGEYMYETPIDLARKIMSEIVVKPIEEREGWNLKYLAIYIDLLEKEGKHPCTKRAKFRHEELQD